MHNFKNLSITSLPTHLVFFSLWWSATLVVSLASLALGISLFYPVGFFLLILGIYSSIAFPAPFLFGITILRMSLDYTSEYVSLQIGRDLTINLSQLMGAGIFIIGGCFILAHFLRVIRMPLVFAWLALMLFSALSALYSINLNETLQEVLRTANLFILYAIAYSAIRSGKDYRKLLLALIYSSLIPVAFAVYQYANGIGVSDENFTVPRIFGTFSHANVFGLYLVSIIVSAVSFLFVYAQSFQQKLIVSSILCLDLLLLLLTFSRVSWLMLFIFLLLIALSSYRLLLLPLVLVPLLLFLTIPSIQLRILEALNPSPTSSLTWRVTHWKEMINQTFIDQRVALGYGINTFPLVSAHLREDKLGSNDPHNDLVKFFVEGGLTGLGVYLLFLALTARQLLHNFRHAANEEYKFIALATLSLFITVVIAGMTENAFSVTPLQWILWTLIGAGMPKHA